MTGTTTQQQKDFRVLHLDSSGRIDGSATRSMTNNIVAAIEDNYGNINITRRDLADGVAFVNSAWIDANFTAADQRSEAQQAALQYSDELVAEIQAADAIVIGVPIYNFGIPATVKAWIDMVARAGVTFRYTPDGPQGLLENKKVYVAIASGGVPIDSPADFATPYLRHALKFIGITDIEVFSAAEINRRGDEALATTQATIAERVTASHLSSGVAA